ncbi:hypothetical protein A9Z64_11460 [Moraxella osloensis]|nr:hypothetical protein A9Z64_11460 [Moraxella osloensis]
MIARYQLNIRKDKVKLDPTFIRMFNPITGVLIRFKTNKHHGFKVGHDVKLLSFGEFVILMKA